jgi:hypothetical protein
MVRMIKQRLLTCCLPVKYSFMFDSFGASQAFFFTFLDEFLFVIRLHWTVKMLIFWLKGQK